MKTNQEPPADVTASTLPIDDDVVAGILSFFLKKEINWKQFEIHICFIIIYRIASNAWK